MNYICVHVRCQADFVDIIIAEMAEIGFDTFMETEPGFEASIDETLFDESLIQNIVTTYASQTTLFYDVEHKPKQNWNEEWEKHVEPIVVDNRCLIRSIFHCIEKKYPYEIIITPKMSFGTGHHPTTSLMIQNQLDIDHQGKRVMDAGCGTAILSIMAMKRGARCVEAFDMDEWSMSNGKENVEINQVQHVTIQQGTISACSFDQPFDIILANINKNVLLNEMKWYAQYLVPHGKLVLSGFFESDVNELNQQAILHQMVFISMKTQEKWASLLFEKIDFN